MAGAVACDTYMWHGDTWQELWHGDTWQELWHGDTWQDLWHGDTWQTWSIRYALVVTER